MQKKALEKKTRRTFHEIHKAQGDDNYIFTRLSTLLSTDFLKVEPDFFKGKICLDAGCGSNANATFNMLSLGAEKVYAFDLDETIVKTAPKYLRKFKRKYELSIGNVFKIHFPDNYFDFTHCAGVLHHTVDVYKGLAELARVTKKGGTLICGLRVAGRAELLPEPDGNKNDGAGQHDGRAGSHVEIIGNIEPHHSGAGGDQDSQQHHRAQIFGKQVSSGGRSDQQGHHQRHTHGLQRDHDGHRGEH